MLDRLGVTLPIIQAPMAGVSTPALAAEVSNAGALGSIGVGATDAIGARKMIEEVRVRTDRAFNVNVFVHGAANANAEREAAWLEWLAPLFPSSALNAQRNFERSTGASRTMMTCWLFCSRPACRR